MVRYEREGMLGCGPVDIPTPGREPDVVSAFSALDYTTNELAGAVELLEKRLSPVLNPGGQTCSATKGVEPYGECEISRAARVQADRVGGAAARLRDLIDRLEV